MQPDEPHDACCVHGTLSLNKVSGNFHITAGKSVPLMRGHAHLTQFMGPQVEAYLLTYVYLVTQRPSQIALNFLLRLRHLSKKWFFLFS